MDSLLDIVRPKFTAIAGKYIGPEKAKVVGKELNVKNVNKVGELGHKVLVKMGLAQKKDLKGKGRVSFWEVKNTAS